MELSPLIWLAIGCVIMGLEVVVPGFVVFWFGLGAIVTAALTFFGVTESGASQWMVFFVSSLSTLGLWQLYFKKFFKGKVVDDVRDATLTNRRGRVTKRITPNMVGQVELYDVFHGLKTWSAQSNSELSFEEGEEVQVVEADGIKLIVRKPD